MDKLIAITIIFFLTYACQSLTVDERFKELGKQEKKHLVSELDTMVEQDQYYRFLVDDLDESSDQYKQKRDSIWDIINRIDMANTQRLIEITENYGFPNVDRLDAPIPVWLIFQHAPKEYFDQLKILLKGEYEAGRIPSLEYQMISWHLGHRKESFPLIFREVSGENSKNTYDDYYKHVWNGMLSYQDKDYQNSLSSFQNAFEIIPDENVTHYFYGAAAALHLKKDSLAQKFITEAIIHTNASEKYFLRFSEFDEYRENKMLKDIEREYPHYTSIFYEKLAHPDIYREMEYMLEKDQAVRNSTVDAEQMRLVDSLNVIRLTEITKEYGWQKKGWTILWHHRGSFRTDNYVWSYFRPLINEQIEEGNINKNFWAEFEDEESISQNAVQIYGTYWGQLDLYPIKDIQTIDERRKEIGLPPLWYMEKVYNIPVPKKYLYPAVTELE